jgi:hypothetical protein
VPIYCPRCGQHQLSLEVRFCSRCGLHLESVERIVAAGGLVSAPADSALEDTPRQRGLRLGAKLLFVSAVLFPICIGLAVAFDHPASFVVFAAMCLAGIARMLYARNFESAAPQPWHGRPIGPADWTAGALPPRQPPSSLGRGATTGELEPPPSVTEHSTYLLDR